MGTDKKGDKAGGKRLSEINLYCRAVFVLFISLSPTLADHANQS